VGQVLLLEIQLILVEMVELTLVAVAAETVIMVSQVLAVQELLLFVTELELLANARIFRW
jgi:hypothetical protein